MVLATISIYFGPRSIALCPYVDYHLCFHRSTSMSEWGKLCTHLFHALLITPFVVYCILCYVLPPSEYSRSFSSKDFIKEILLFELCCACSYAVLIHLAFMLNTNQLCPQRRSCITTFSRHLRSFCPCNQM